MALARHQVTSNTVGLWQFDWDGTDSSGNGYDLTLEAGIERYSDLWPGVSGALFNGGVTKFYRSSAEAALRILGDMTIEFFYMSLINYPSGYVCYHGTSGESLPTNYLYSVSYESGNASTQWLQEYGAGSDSLYQFTEELPPPRSLIHVAATRRSDVIRLYHNGRLVGTSSALTTPEDGSSGRLRVGEGVNGIVSSLKILNVGLTDEEIVEEYNSTFGPVFGEL